MVAIASTHTNVKKRFEYRISYDSTNKDYKISIIVFYSKRFICLNIIIHRIIASIPFLKFGFIFIFLFFSINEWRSIFDDVAWHIDASREISRECLCVGSISLCKVYPLKVNTRCYFSFRPSNSFFMESCIQ